MKKFNFLVVGCRLPVSGNQFLIQVACYLMMNLASCKPVTGNR